MKKFLQQTALAAGLMAVGLGAQAQTVTLKVHHFLSAQTIQHTTMLGEWCKNLARDSKDRLKCDIFPSMQLGGTPSAVV
jgi:TRAP-type transport system periplasmic protein